MMMIQLYFSHVSATESRMLRSSEVFKELNLDAKIYWLGCKGDHSNIGIEELENGVQLVNIFVSNLWYKIPLLGRFIRQLIWYVKCVKQMAKLNIEKANLVQSNSISDLPIAVYLSKILNCKLIYEPHELETERIDLRGIHQIIDRLIEKYFIAYADAITVVSKSILNWYTKMYKLKNIFLIRNLPNFMNEEPSDSIVNIKEDLKIESAELLYVYLGMISKSRGIEIIVDVFRRNKDKHVLFLGYGPLVPYVIEESITYSNIHYHESIKQNELSSFLSNVDVGLSIIENQCLSYYYCLPNKMWEYLHSNIPIIASNFPDMKEVVEEYEVGWTVNPNENDLNLLVKNITLSDVIDKKRNISETKLISWEEERIRLMDIYQNILGQGL